MSKQAHTPGPWSYDQDENEIHSDSTSQCDGDPAHICEMLGPKIRREANAHLIAAAPELLDALKKAYQQCIEFLNEGDFRRNVEWDAGYIVDAIAKAEGRHG